MMAGIYVRRPHLKLIAASHVRNSLRSGAGVIFLVMSLLVGIILASVAVLPVETAMKVVEVLGNHAELDPESKPIADFANARTDAERTAALADLKKIEAERSAAIKKALDERGTSKLSSVEQLVEEKRKELEPLGPKFNEAIATAEAAHDETARRNAAQTLADIHQKRWSIETRMGSALQFDRTLGSWAPKLAGAFVGEGDEEIDFLVHDRPALVSMFMILLFSFLPFLVALSGFNQTSGDIGSRGLRYLLLRTERSNVFLGRLIGTYLFTLVVITLIVAVVGLYIVMKVPFYSTPDVLMWLLRCWFACALFALPWVAFCAWISAVVPVPFLSLLISAGGLLFWIILSWVARDKNDALGYMAYLTPWGFRWWLLDFGVGKFLGGVVAMLGFTGIFTMLGLRTFNRRDV